MSYHPYFVQQDDSQIYSSFLQSHLLKEEIISDWIDEVNKDGFLSTLLPTPSDIDNSLFDDFEIPFCSFKTKEKESKESVWNSTDKEVNDTLWILKNSFPIDFSKDFSLVSSEALNMSQSPLNQLCYRRDVVNKNILRLFRKKISKLFSWKIKRQRGWLNSSEDLKKKLLIQAEDLGLINLEDENHKSREFQELVCWIAISKMTIKLKSIFDFKNKSVQILSDILCSYSHSKLLNLYEDKLIWMLFDYFIKHWFTSSIEPFSHWKRIIYTKAAIDMMQNFNYSS